MDLDSLLEPLAEKLATSLVRQVVAKVAEKLGAADGDTLLPPVSRAAVQRAAALSSRHKPRALPASKKPRAPRPPVDPEVRAKVLQILREAGVAGMKPRDLMAKSGASKYQMSSTLEEAKAAGIVKVSGRTNSALYVYQK